MNQADLIALARETALAHGLDDSLVCAVIEQESSWNPWATRYEPGFYNHYIAPILGISQSEGNARATSWGLMQLMGQVARERGFANTYLANLLEPCVGIEYGCQHLKAKLALAGGDVTKALLLWNGGGNTQYPAQVLARQSKYQSQTNHDAVQSAANGEN